MKKINFSPIKVLRWLAIAALIFMAVSFICYKYFDIQEFKILFKVSFISLLLFAVAGPLTLIVITKSR